MKTSFIFKSFFAAFVLFASAALVSCEKENETPESEASKPAAVSFKYTNYETEDMLEYCNIVIEYTDVNGTNVETITTTSWTKEFVTPLPCSYSFKKTYTLKADKDVASVEKIQFGNRMYAYSWEILDANGNKTNKSNFGSTSSSMTTSGSKIAEQVPTGRLDVETTFTFDKDGNELN
jgi:hypothetical protein